MKKYWMIGTLLFLGILSGCGFNSNADVQGQIEDLLENKYGKEFSILSVEKESGSHAFEQSQYYAEATVKEGADKFDVLTDMKITESRDNYAKLLFDEEICKKLDTLLEAADGLNGYTYSVNYPMEERAWSESDVVDTYLKDSGIIIYIDLQEINAEPEMAAKYVYSLAEGLYENQIPCTLDYSVQGKEIPLSIECGQPLISYDKYLERLRNWGEDE